MTTKIAWTDESWNPVTGCTPVSEGCAHCYAKRMTERFGGDFSKVVCHPVRLNSENSPLHWRKPRMVFVPSMGDLFHEDVPDEFIRDVFWTMQRAGWHTFQVLTKRPERMRAFLVGAPVLPNIWLGVSVENQARADERIPILLDTPAAVRFVSAEPLLGPLDLTPWVYEQDPIMVRVHGPRGKLDWVICGGESGGPPERRLVAKNWCGDDCPYTVHDEWRPKFQALEWVRRIRDDCHAAGVPFFFKQWGPKAGQGTLLDGREHKEMPR